MSHTLNIKTAGIPLKQAEKALIMIHGRGGSAQDILSLSQHLNVKDYALLAPQALNHTWYPLSFMAPVDQNEPWLSSALEMVGETVKAALDAGIKPENMYFFGFSQGACLTLEFLARNARRFGGATAIIGGVIGDKINRENYKGDFAGTPVFLGTSNPDFHVPVERVYATANIFREMNADVTEKVYANFGHSINQEEMELANTIIFK
ncbi:dienelactone hydrolase family protein [Chryseobacterium indologenes]|uniref:alpha/beta hydrolase n=1 Tax=Chryseobacterium TaxID=59732 RepID=UPI0003E06B01|nr:MULTISPECIES: dienelactone hydrolase family protein [Chryseobacterium]AYZ34966.1 phospholipase [Chryseobacterium indologenes]MBF6643709.1 dienelactone hydrolase family protein [Chryseobacterium indologenes]MBU3046703.1 dienelactone hydrolase family protein [Chryseobacterium indologenes]MEB4761617.1 dienelactone hydrolase family protein [Chryseobacterium indologenes]QPQ52015.1 dienelactone hydrolase family protein [Chryseobacterium indologenes]